MFDTIFKMFMETGNVYIIIITLLALSLFLVIRYMLKDGKKDNILKFNFKQASTNLEKAVNDIKEEIVDTNEQFEHCIKEIKDSLSIINSNVDKIYIEHREKLKDILNKQDKTNDIVKDCNYTIKEVKDEIVNLKYKVELMIIQNNNTSSVKINKGL